MTFPINSTSVITPACERVCRVMQRVAKEGLISYGGVFSCRKIAGTNYWSQHAWGNALDLFPTDGKYNDKIARAAVTQATKRTFANRGRKLDLSNVIDHLNGRIWTPGTGWHEYNARSAPTSTSRLPPSRPVPLPVRDGSPVLTSCYPQPWWPGSSPGSSGPRSRISRSRSIPTSTARSVRSSSQSIRSSAKVRLCG